MRYEFFTADSQGRFTGEDGASLHFDGVPDVVRLPDDLGGNVESVTSAFRAECVMTSCGALSTHLVLQTLNVCTCHNHPNPFMFYRQK